jgi:hypothetical protein
MEVALPNITWSNCYLSKINALQRQRYFFDLRGFYSFLDMDLLQIVEEIRSICSSCEKLTQDEATNRNLLHLLRARIRKLLSRFDLYIDFVHLITKLTEKDRDINVPIGLYFPIHVDRSLRMYSAGNLNPVSNKALRLLFLTESQLTQTVFTEEEDLVRRFFLTVLRKKASHYDDVFSKEELMD